MIRRTRQLRHSTVPVAKIRNRTLMVTALVVLAALVLYCCTQSVEKSQQQVEYAAYPHTYAQYVDKEARRLHLDSALVYAVIKQESNFDPNCVSNAGAVGLMQIMPDTFDWLTQGQQKSGGQSYETKDLYTPEINIHYGCQYLSTVLKMYTDTNTALAAYNAGIGNVNDWLKDKALSADGKTLKEIPFSETRAYTSRVLTYYQKYKQLYPVKSASSAETSH